MQLSPVAQLAILRRIMQKTDGRDKILKIVQYFAKLVLLFKSYKDLVPLINSLSLSRRFLRFLHVLEPAGDLLALKPSTGFSETLKLVSVLISLVNDTVDDVITLSKIKSLDAYYARALSPVSDRLWFSSILIDLYEGFVQGQKTHKAWKRVQMSAQEQRARMKRIAQTQSKTEGGVAYEYRSEFDDKAVELRDKLFMVGVGQAKLLCDLVFCGVDVFGVHDAGGRMQTVSGLLSGLLGTYKLVVKEQ